MDLNVILTKHFKDTLTEEVKGEINVLFEAAISEKVSEIVKTKEAELVEKYKKELVEFKNTLVTKLDDYIALTVEDFVTENKEPLENSVKIEMANNVITKLIDVLKENYVKIPENEIDTIKDLTGQIQSLTTKLNEEIAKNTDNVEQSLEYEKAIEVLKSTEGLTAVDKEKVASLVENVDVKNIVDFKTKLNVIVANLNKVDDATALLENNNNGDDLDIKGQKSKIAKQKSEIDKYIPK